MVEIEPKDMMDILFNHKPVLILSALGFIIVIGTLLSILLSQRLHKRHRGYNPTENQVCLFFKIICYKKTKQTL
jgi:receptor tyrosine kinase